MGSHECDLWSNWFKNAKSRENHIEPIQSLYNAGDTLRIKPFHKTRFKGKSDSQRPVKREGLHTILSHPLNTIVLGLHYTALHDISFK